MSDIFLLTIHDLGSGEQLSRHDYRDWAPPIPNVGECINTVEDGETLAWKVKDRAFVYYDRPDDVANNRVEVAIWVELSESPTS